MRTNIDMALLYVKLHSMLRPYARIDAIDAKALERSMELLFREIVNSSGSLL
jgi:hypothetical protein